MEQSHYCGVWSLCIDTGCVCGSGFQSSSNNRSCVGTLSAHLSVCFSLPVFLFSFFLPTSVACGAGTYGTGGTCLPCPANSNSTQSGLSVCPCFEGYYRAAWEPPGMACTRKSHMHARTHKRTHTRTHARTHAHMHAPTHARTQVKSKSKSKFNCFRPRGHSTYM